MQNPAPLPAEFLLHLTKRSVIIIETQGSYIGNTTASQAVKAGSTPVSCSTKETSFVYQDKRGFSLHEYSGIV